MKIKYILIPLAVLVLAGTFFLVFKKIEKNRKSVPNEVELQTHSSAGQNNTAENAASNSQTDIQSSDSNSSEDDDQQDSENNQENAYLDVDKNDCENNCLDFKDTPDDYKYCREFCGITEKDTKKSGDCGNLNGLDKDYCLKDQAIEKEDIKFCEDIEDGKIKQACKNRVFEDIMDKSKLSD
jgi:hypothetical protein